MVSGKLGLIGQTLAASYAGDQICLRGNSSGSHMACFGPSIGRYLCESVGSGADRKGEVWPASPRKPGR